MPTFDIAYGDAGWNLHLRRCDPIQYTEYDEGGKYDWNIDPHD